MPMRINRMLKRELRAQNQLAEGPLNSADEMAKYRPGAGEAVDRQTGTKPSVP